MARRKKPIPQRRPHFLQTQAEGVGAHTNRVTSMDIHFMSLMTQRLTQRLTHRIGTRWIKPTSILLIPIVITAIALQRFVWERSIPAVLPESRALQLIVKGAGELVAREQATVSSKTVMAVKTVLVDVGSEVQRGQPLALLESEELAAQVRLAQAAERAAWQGMELAQVAQQRMAVVLRRSEADAQRAILLATLDPDAISGSDLDASTSNAASTALDTRGTELQVQAARHAHAEAVAQLDLARTRLSDATLKAPFDGLIVKRHCSKGDVSAPGSPCFTLINPGSLRIQVRFDESALARVRPGDKADLLLKSHPHTGLRAQIERFNRAVDSDTREFSVDMKPEQLPPTWALGERATAQVQIPLHQAALAIPLSHVVNTEAGRSVWISRDGRAHSAVLKLGLSDGRQVEVLAGLDATEAVLAPTGLRAGMRVKPEPMPWQ